MAPTEVDDAALEGLDALLDYVVNNQHALCRTEWNLVERALSENINRLADAALVTMLLGSGLTWRYRVASALVLREMVLNLYEFDAMKRQLWTIAPSLDTGFGRRARALCPNRYAGGTPRVDVLPAKSLLRYALKVVTFDHTRRSTFAGTTIMTRSLTDPQTVDHFRLRITTRFASWEPLHVLSTKLKDGAAQTTLTLGRPFLRVSPELVLAKKYGTVIREHSQFASRWWWGMHLSAARFLS
jgi:hypothetical protein